jgi:hypothetical protein
MAVIDINANVSFTPTATGSDYAGFAIMVNNGGYVNLTNNLTVDGGRWNYFLYMNTGGRFSAANVQINIPSAMTIGGNFIGNFGGQVAFVGTSITGTGASTSTGTSCTVDFFGALGKGSLITNFPGYASTCNVAGGRGLIY